MIKKYEKLEDYRKHYDSDNSSTNEIIESVDNIEDLLKILISHYTNTRETIIYEWSPDRKYSEKSLLKEVNKIIDKSNELLKDVER